MKRAFTIILAVMMIMAVFTGCGRSDSGNASPSPAIPSSPSTNSNMGGNSGNGNVDDGINSGNGNDNGSSGNSGNGGNSGGNNSIINDAGDAIQDAGNAVEDAVENAVEDAMQSKVGTPPILLTVLTQDGKSILPVHAIKARRVKKDAEEYGIFIHWCDNCECAGKYPNKAAALAEIELMAKHISVGLKTIYKMK